ncbi:hypothetical protein NE237_014197 [Protea cynaroides]|uniref:Uncharacterized protein n=1 Tax=Protea cynaroides TaxID=273540 RepID=A0A9Q0GKP7_9MAGN|nr:hypothetical protein NE237_014197 [Protea cynaroides]
MLRCRGVLSGLILWSCRGTRPQHDRVNQPAEHYSAIRHLNTSTVMFTLSCGGVEVYSVMLRSAEVPSSRGVEECSAVRFLYSLAVMSRSALQSGLLDHASAEVLRRAEISKNAPRLGFLCHAERSASRLCLLGHAEVARSALWSCRVLRSALQSVLLDFVEEPTSAVVLCSSMRLSLLGHAKAPRNTKMPRF